MQGLLLLERSGRSLKDEFGYEKFHHVHAERVASCVGFWP